MMTFDQVANKAQVALRWLDVPQEVGDRAIEALRTPSDYRWTVQGLGMMRVYLDPDHVYRMHIWDNIHRTVGAYKNSDMHTHPWDMQSSVLLGRLTNVLLRETDRKPSRQDYDAMEYKRQLIRCGQSGGPWGDPSICYLEHLLTHEQVAGTEYWQKASAIHASMPTPGTVTLIRRSGAEDADHAWVYWRSGQDWQSAEPHVATPKEVEDTFKGLDVLWGDGD